MKEAQRASLAKIAAERHALAQKIGAEVAETAKADFKKFFNESPTIKKRQAQMKKALSCFAPYRHQRREPVLFTNTGPRAFEPPELLYREDVYSYNCATREITFRDGTTGYCPEALEDRDEA